MLRRWRRPLPVLFCLPGGWHCLGQDAGLSDTNLIADSVPLWTESMLWDEKVTVSSGAGYKDNILLSAFTPQGSGFFYNALDAMVLRVPLDGWKIVGGIVGDDMQYWRDVGTGREDSFLGSFQADREFSGGWETGLEVRGLYEHEVLDISTSDATPATALVDGYTLTVQPSLRKKLVGDLWLKTGLPASRWLMASPLDDYWEFGPVVTAGYDFGERADVTASYSATYQPHDTWTAIPGAAGSPRLEIFQQQAEWAWHQYWDSRQRWRSTTRLVLAWRQDNGSGLFNYFSYKVAEDLRWQTVNWMIEASLDVANEDYPIQSAGFHDPETLSRTFWQASVEVERRIFKGLKSFAKWDYDQCVSNEDLGAENYQANTFSGGLRYEF
jgi:hypothetical protein